MGGSNERPTGLNDAGLFDLDLSIIGVRSVSLH